MILLLFIMLALFPSFGATAASTDGLKLGCSARYHQLATQYLKRMASEYRDQIKEQGPIRLFLADRANPEKLEPLRLIDPLDAVAELGRFKKRLSIPANLALSVAIYSAIDSYYFEPKRSVEERKRATEEDLRALFENYLSQFSFHTPDAARKKAEVHFADLNRWYSGQTKKGTPEFVRFKQLMKLGVIKNQAEKDALDTIAYNALKCTRESWGGDISDRCQSFLQLVSSHHSSTVPFGEELARNFKTALELDSTFAKKKAKERELAQFFFLPPVQFGRYDDLEILHELLVAEEENKGDLSKLARMISTLGVPSTLESANEILEKQKPDNSKLRRISGDRR